MLAHLLSVWTVGYGCISCVDNLLIMHFQYGSSKLVDFGLVNLYLVWILESWFFSGLMPSYVKYLKTSQIELAVFEIWVNSGVFDSLFKIWELFYIKWCKKFGDLILLLLTGTKWFCIWLERIAVVLLIFVSTIFTVSVVLQVMP